MIHKQIEKITKNHIYSEIRARTYIENHAQEMRPVFFLSTGRCGTKLFTKILEQDKSRIVIHNYSPELIVESKSAYEATQTIAQPLIYCLVKCTCWQENKLIWRAKSQKKELIENK